jgi:hypothetical protein
MEIEEKRLLLTKLFVSGFYPYSKVVSGDLKKDYGIELTEICRKTYNGGLSYKPGYESSSREIRWIGGDKTLSWGSNTGWNITEDCEFALCRVEYDDYINFKISFESKGNEIEILFDRYMELLKFEVERFAFKPTELKHLIGRLGELYCAKEVNGNLSKVVNSKGFDVISPNNERISVKTTAQDKSFVSLNKKTMHEFDKLMILQLKDFEFEILYFDDMKKIEEIAHTWSGNETKYELYLNRLRKLK